MLKKYLAMAMAVVFVVSGLIFTPKFTHAGEHSWTGMPGGWAWEKVGNWYLCSEGANGFYYDNTEKPLSIKRGSGSTGEWSTQLGIEAELHTGNAYNCTISFVPSAQTTIRYKAITQGPMTSYTVTADKVGVVNTIQISNVTCSEKITVNSSNYVVGALITLPDVSADVLLENLTITGDWVTPTTAEPTTPSPSDGYEDCTGTSPQYINEGWGYNRVSSDYNIGYRIGAYDGIEYKMELKNRDNAARTLFIYTDSGYETTNGTAYRYSLTIQNNSATSFTASLLGYYGWKEVLPPTAAETVAASTSTTLTGTFTPSGGEYDTAHGRFQIQLNNIPAGAEVGVTAFSVTEVSPWELIDTYGSFKSMGDWEYYVDSSGEAYYDTNYNPNTYDNVGFKYVKKQNAASSTRYRMRTSVLTDSDGKIMAGDYYDYSFTVRIDSDSTDALSANHIKVVEYTGDTATSYTVLQELGAIAKGATADVSGTCGATVNGSRIGIVVDTEDDIALHITDFEFTRRGSEVSILKSSKINIEGFQIRSNNPLASINFRTLCKAPNIGSKITVDGTEYTIDGFGTSYALDPNNSGHNENNVLNSSYTVLDENGVEDKQWQYEGVKPYNGQNRTYGYEASGEAIIADWRPGDTANTYYAFTMTNLDKPACNTIWVRPFVKTTTGKLIYGNTTAFTSVAEIAAHLYTNSLSKNATAHSYLYNSILHNTSIVPTTNPYYQATETVYGWSNGLYIGFRLIPDTWNEEKHTEEMQYVNIEDWRVHANSSYGGAQGSYKGVTNEELTVRIEKAGTGYKDDWDNWLNWGIQIRLPNRTAYKRLEAGKTYEMTISYHTTQDGLMRVKCEGNDPILTKYRDNRTYPNPSEYTKEGYHEDGIGHYPATAGYNTITETFVYSDAFAHGQNDASIVLMPCPSQGDVEGNGFGDGTIISDISISFDEVTS